MAKELGAGPGRTPRAVGNRSRICRSRSSPARCLSGLLQPARTFASLLAAAVWLHLCACGAAEKFSIATYNVESYVETPTGNRPAKTERSKAKVRESILALNADILALQEIGGTNALLELKSGLKQAGANYEHWELVCGFDTNIQVAVLSKFPISARRSHNSDGFLLNGRRFRLTRAIVDVDVQVRPDYTLTLLVAHLKSRRPAPEADEADLREQEALVLREKIDALLQKNPAVHLAVVGDLNDTKESRSTRAVMGKGRMALVDLRPAERNGDSLASGRNRSAARNVNWTHFYGKDDTYSRLDYILVSHELSRSLDLSGTYVLALPNWGEASDHRPIAARFLLP